LDGLEAVEGSIREVVEERVAVVKAGRNKRIGERSGSIGVKEWSYLSKDAKLEEGRLTDRGDVAGEGVV